MGNDDFILDSIFNILQADTEKPEDGYFRSDRERAYRSEEHTSELQSQR